MKRRALLLTIALAILLAALAPSMEAVGIASLWYLQDRLDVGNYTYVNAIAEINDPHNLIWINERIGY